jgi:hypothetical protein
LQHFFRSRRPVHSRAVFIFNDSDTARARGRRCARPVPGFGGRRATAQSQPRLAAAGSRPRSAQTRAAILPRHARHGLPRVLALGVSPFSLPCARAAALHQILRDRATELRAEPGNGASFFTLGLILPALGIRLLAVADDQALERFQKQPRYRAGMAGANAKQSVALLFSRRHFARIGRIGGQRTRQYLRKAKARALARKGWQGWCLGTLANHSSG